MLISVAGFTMTVQDDAARMTMNTSWKGYRTQWRKVLRISDDECDGYTNHTSPEPMVLIINTPVSSSSRIIITLQPSPLSPYAPSSHPHCHHLITSLIFVLTNFFFLPFFPFHYLLEFHSSWSPVWWWFNDASRVASSFGRVKKTKGEKLVRVMQGEGDNS